MPFPLQHSYLVVHGTVEIGGLLDVWQFGLRLAGGGAGQPAQTDDALNDVLADVTAWWTRERPRYNPTVKCLGIKLNAIGTDGLYVDDETRMASVAGASQPGTHTQYPPLPSQVAIAVTLHTAADRGYASKGRVYLPAPTSGMSGNDGTIFPANRTAIAESFRDLVVALNDSPGLDATGNHGVVSVLSRVGAGMSRPVTGVSVGSRFDVQRRRANKIRETRTVVAVP